jgi:hypothetical protein
MDSFGTASTLRVGNWDDEVFRLPGLERHGFDVARCALPDGRLRVGPVEAAR